MKKYLLIVFAALLLIAGSATATTVIESQKHIHQIAAKAPTVTPQPTTLPTSTPTQDPTPTLTSIPTRIPTPTVVQPSTNQLSIAAYLVGISTAEVKAQFKSMHNLPENTSDDELIQYVAHDYVVDPMKYAQAQGQVDQIKGAGTSQPAPLYVAPRQSVLCTSNTSGALTDTYCW